MKDLAEKILDSIGIINNEFRAQKILEDAHREDEEGYELDEDGNRRSHCCWAVIGDNMRCSKCNDNC
tara:strand:- start:10733 stop:10933 length:201 start_codon:yes stop_codon:yes gene_type:complete